MTVGKANPPDAIKNQRIETATQEQRIQTGEADETCRGSAAAGEQSRANAENAYREAMHLSPEQSFSWEQSRCKGKCCGGNGKAGCTFIQNGSAVSYAGLK